MLKGVKSDFIYIIKKIKKRAHSPPAPWSNLDTLEGWWWAKDWGVHTWGWLSHSPLPLNEVSRDMRVCELIDQDTRQWDRGKIFATIAHRTQVEILAIPLNNPNSQDTLAWKENQG